MSYDLMVFEKTKAPMRKGAFLQWYHKQAEWSEDHDCQTIGVSSFALQNWFMEMKEIFPSLNGAYAPTDDEIHKRNENQSFRKSNRIVCSSK